MARATPTLLARGVAYLARREHSRAELARKLSPHAESLEALEAVLDQLTGAGLQSDARFAEALVRVRGQGYGAARLKHELRQRGVSDALVNNALEPAHASEAQRLFRVWEKRFGQPPTDLAERAKQQRFLAARGFSPGLYQALERRGFSAPEHD